MSDAVFFELLTRFLDTTTGKVQTRSINSCLAPVGGLDGAAVTTVEGIGSSDQGFHPIQERIAGFHASQCGFCTPGFVVAAHSVLRKAKERGKPATADDFQAGMDGNLCRCTGYRPIIDACKSLTGCADLEDLGICAPGCVHTAAQPADIAFPDFLQTRGQGSHGGGGAWRRPTSLAQLAEALQGRTAGGVRLLAGNTGPGIYKEMWPQEGVVVDVRHVAELNYERRSQDALEVGGAVTLSALIEALQRDSSSADDPWSRMAAHLLRIAGTHVRNAATIGGNLALARDRRLESDLATVLMGAGASVCIIEAAAGSAESARLVPVEDWLALKQGPPLLVLGISIPAFDSAAVFRSHKVSQRFYNSHSILNAALSFTRRGGGGGALETVRVAVGCFDTPDVGKGVWTVRRQQGVEVALQGRLLTADSAVAALRALRQDLGENAHPLNVQLAEGVLLSALGPLVQDANASPRLRRLLAAAAMDPPGAGSAKQTWPDYSKDAPPVHEAVEKDAVRLQASGEATYTSDIGVGSGQLFAATVATSQAAQRIVRLDASAAEKVPGFVAFISAGDVPRGGKAKVFGDTLFATDFADYAGQRLGLAVATSQLAAERAAAAVEVEYSRAGADGNTLAPPILTLPDAERADSFFDVPALRADNPEVAAANAARVDEALASSPHAIRGARYTIGSQQHFYMEPQSAVAIPDEGGSITIHSATQGLDAVQRAVATTLGLPFHQVKVVCRRIGGGFGGKASRCLPAAVGAAVAATALKWPVRYVLNRNDDMRQNAGRCTTDITYDVGFDKEGKLTALRIRGAMLAGAVQDLAADDTAFLAAGADMAYSIPAMEVKLKLARSNLPPRSIVRGPGYLQAVMVIEQVVEHVAAELGLDAAVVKRRNFIAAPEQCQTEPAAESVATGGAAGGGAAGAASEAAVGGNAAATERPCFAGPAAGLSGGEQVLSTAQGRRFKASLYTLPRIWDEIQETADFSARRRAVEAFNRDNAWRKRGIAITPCRFDANPPAMAASAHVYADGSVMVASGGLEMGQGLFTKVKQMAALTLGKALPGGRPLPLARIRVGDSGSDGHPGCGTTWSSTGSESACEAVRLACEKIVKALGPIVKEAGDGATWEQIIEAAQGNGNGFTPTKVPLSAMAWWDGSAVGGDKAGREQLSYVAFGAAVSEVEIDVLTGEKLLLRSDILFDCGHSLNPGIDIGQVEGAFVQGLGIQTVEEVVTDGDGRLVTDGTWHYKIPTPVDIPRQLNVSFLKDSPNPKGIMSSKASGEPCLMLSTSVLTALQNAIIAARKETGAGKGVPAVFGGSGGVEGKLHKAVSRALVAHLPVQPVLLVEVKKPLSLLLQGGWHCLTAPATTVKLRQAVGAFTAAHLLEAAAAVHPESSPAHPQSPPAHAGAGSSSNGSWEVV